MKKHFLLLFCIFVLSTKLTQGQDFAGVAFSSTSDYITTDWNPSFGADQDFSIDFAIRTDEWSSDPAVISDKDWGSGSNPGFNIALASDGTSIDVNVGDGSNRADLQAGTINDGEWHNVLVSFDRDGELSMWIDGNLVQSTDMSGVGNIDSEFNFTIGQDGTTTYGAAATCEVTNIRVWDFAAAFEDISDYTCDIVPMSEPIFANILHYWTLQEATGTTTLDIVAGNDGTFQGDAAWVGGFFPDISVGFAFLIDGSSVVFSNSSTNATAFVWDFGDGNTSTAETPTHTYLSTGVYEVMLTAFTLCGPESATQTVTIGELSEGLLTSLDLDGEDDVVTLENDLNFGNDQDFTIELFVRTDGWAADPGLISNKDWNSGGNPGFILAAKTDNTTWKFNIGDGGDRIDIDGGVINDGNWHHIAVVYDQDGLKQLWQDGEFVADSDAVINGSVDTALDLIIGADGNSNFPFTGQIAQVRIWNSVLDSMTLADFTCLVDESHPNLDQLLHYWKLDEGAGTLVADSQGNNNGTYNGAWTSTLNTIAACGDAPVGESFNAAFVANSSREDYIATSWLPDFGTDQDFSVEFRLKTTGWDGDPALISNKDWNSGGNPGFNIALAGNGNGIDVNAGDGGGNRADLESGSIADGVWHHILVTFDRDGEMSMYIDGSLAQSTSMANVGTLNSEFTLNIGQDGTGDYPVGFSTTGPVSEVAELKIWNRVISLDELDICAALSPEDPLFDDVLHYWKMNEGTGTTAADSKGDDDGIWQGNEAWTGNNNFPNAIAAFTEDAFLSTISFINLSSPGNYFWDFGDGTTSTDANPSHTYLSTGTFEVKLIVANACDQDSITKELVITELDNNLFNSLDLDGMDDFVVLENTLNFGDAGDFTIELWAKSTGWNSDPSIFANKDWGSGGNPGFIIAGKGDGTNWKFNIGDGSDRIDLDGGAINDGVWHHLVVSYDQDGEKILYHDGVLFDQSSTVLGDVSSTLDLAIGQDGTLNYGAFFRGQVAEIRVWDTVLDEITLQDYLCGITADHPALDNLLHYWKLDEGEGVDIADSQSDNLGTYNGNWITSANTFEDCSAPIPLNEVGAGNAIDFDGFNDYVAVPQNDIFEIEENITLEAWVKARSLGQWESFLNYVQDNGSNESGFDFAYVDNKLRFRIMTTTMGGNDWNDNPGFNIPLDTWVHVAGTYDGETVKMYVNGVLMESENKNGPLDWEFQPIELRIGSYIDDNELYYWDGAVDEVRIWNVARTEEEIRTTMCVELAGNEDGLLAYYRLDELAGEEVFDAGPNDLDGGMFDMVPAQDRVISGAGIGDESTFIYPADWTDVSLSLGSDDQGELTVENVQGILEGVQIYRVDNTPLFAEDFVLLENNDAYFGVVPSTYSGPTFDVNLNYNNIPEAVADEANLLLGSRQSAEVTTWVNTAAVVDEDADELFKSPIGGRREFIIGTSTGVTCAFPSDVALDDVSFSTLDISWFSPSGATNVEYAPAGFPLGAGTLVESAPGSLSLEDLPAATSFDFYLQEVCGPDDLSTWVGPFTFSTEVCLPPAELDVTDITPSSVTFTWSDSDNATAYNIEWGFPGFSLGTGITIDSINSGYVLEGLPSDTDFEFYVQSVCGDAGESIWIGPFSFATILVNTNEIAAKGLQMAVFPNPGTGIFHLMVQSEIDAMADLALYNVLGERVFTTQVDLAADGATILDLQQLPKGTYTLMLQSDAGTTLNRIVIQ